MLRKKRRIAFFGGTFDPIHEGHLTMAQAAVEALELDQVFFVPAGQNPLKGEAPIVSNLHRLEMIRLGIAKFRKFGIWDAELYREGPSYTLDSIRHIGTVFPNSHLFWIIGSDQLRFLSQWHGIDELVQRVGFIHMRRPGYAEDWPGIPRLTLYPVDNPLVPVSATDIRSRAAQGLSLHGLVPEAVGDYIRAHGLYG